MAFEQWCILELMGHQRIAGKITEQVIAGQAMLRVDVPKTASKESFTVFYTSNAVYRIVPTDEKTARAAAEYYNEAPVSPYILKDTLSPKLSDKVSTETQHHIDADESIFEYEVWDDDNDDIDDPVYSPPTTSDYEDPERF